MASSKAKTVTAYLAELPPERRAVVKAVRAMVCKHLQPGFEETMNWGMISYEIPLSRHAGTHNERPLVYVAIAAQKNAYSLYLLGPYTDPVRRQALEQAFERAGKKMDMGKSCLRFKSLDDLPLGDVGTVIASMSADDYITQYEANRKR
jgi:uncharacterized protein YdhG (YjbR/CyaY superfamily)